MRIWTFALLLFIGITTDANSQVHSIDTLFAQAKVRLGEEGPEPVWFERIEALDVSSSGTVYVLDGLACRVRAFSREGSETWSFGREGRGPGEFTWLWCMAPDFSASL